MAEHFTPLGELLAKNIARTARIQLDGRHLLFGEYLQNWTTLYLLNFQINRQLNIDGGKHVLVCLFVVVVFFLTRSNF